MRFGSSASEGTYEDGVGAALVAALGQPQGAPTTKGGNVREQPS